MSENPIVRKNDELVPQEDGSVEPMYGKVLKVTPGTEGFDINGMLAKLMQYANMADALSHVERTLEYVVQIPIKHREAFDAGEVFLNQNTKTGVMWPTLYETLENGKRKFLKKTVVSFGSRNCDRVMLGGNCHGFGRGPD